MTLKNHEDAVWNAVRQEAAINAGGKCVDGVIINVPPVRYERELEQIVKERGIVR